MIKFIQIGFFAMGLFVLAIPLCVGSGESENQKSNAVSKKEDEKKKDSNDKETLEEDTLGPNSKSSFQRRMEASLLTLSPSSIETFKTLDPNYTKSKWFKALEQAHIAIFFNQGVDVQNYYMQAISFPMPPGVTQLILLEMADVLYSELHLPTKVADIYEKFIEEYPNHPIVPELYIKLGRIYREMGVYDLSITKFYNIINLAIRIKESEINHYKKFVIRAQIEIGETFFQNGNYGETLHTIARIQKKDISPEEQKHIDFQVAYCQFNLKDYTAAKTSFKELIQKYPDADFIPECMFLLASTDKYLNQLNDAVSIVIQLLKQQKVFPAQKETLPYWQKRASNQIANEFYEQGDFINAIKIYQAIIPINKDPNWQWPVIYQIGRCFERIQQLDRAKEAYQILVSSKEWQDYPITPALKSIQDMASWRLNHIQWITKTEVSLNKLLAPPAVPTKGK